MPQIIDFHTHAFPDALAAKAVPALAKEGGVRAYANGTVSDLLASMDRAGIDKSVICSIATRPEQFEPILAWSNQVRSERLEPLPSVHPDDPLVHEHIKTISEQGFKGIKLHPYYQDFYLDEVRMIPLYETVYRYDLLLVMHTGFDIAFPRIRRADPEKILRVLERLPELKLITTHLGSWDDWDEVADKLIGKPVYLELSFSLDYLKPETARHMIEAHPPEYILFGTDSPWKDQEKAIQLFNNLGFDHETNKRILQDNARSLLSGTERRKYSAYIEKRSSKGKEKGALEKIPMPLFYMASPTGFEPVSPA